MSRFKGLYLLDEPAFKLVYPPAIQQQIAQLIDADPKPLTAQNMHDYPERLAEVEILLSGWGIPTFDGALLSKMPRLQVIFYGAGAIGHFVTDAIWERDIVVTTAQEANSIPVAEFTFASILLSLKHAWRLARQTREQKIFPNRDTVPGCFGATVGLISLGAIARRLLTLLAGTDLKIIVYDPFLTQREARTLNVELVGLDELFERADVVSLHTPLMLETRGLIRGAHLSSMKPGATFINTARGAVVCEPEMIEVLSQRPDLEAILDVTVEEPPRADSAIYTLPNVMLTPHIAGSAGAECQRMGQYMADELGRFVRGEPLKWQVTPQKAARTPHRPVARGEAATPTAKPGIATVSP
jgi:phosphoglycerate dehydrogenase-like enzyme